MSHISSDRGAAVFRRGVVGVIVALVLLCTGFVVLGSVQGPKLETARLDVVLAVTQPGQQLELIANQVLAQVAPEQVTIEPTTPFTVESVDSTVVVRFESALRNDTTYRVVVDGVTSPYRDQPGALEYAFTTAPAMITYLDEGDSVDRILRVALDGEGEQVLFEQTGIHDFAVIGQALAVVLEPTGGSSAIQIVLPGDNRTSIVTLPEPGIVSDLQSIPELAIIGFRFTSATEIGQRDYQDTLFWLDAIGGIEPAPVLGIDGEPLRVADWQFLGSTGVRVLALSDERSLVLVDLGGAPATPLGQYPELLGVSVNGRQATVNDGRGPVVIDLISGTESRYALSPLDGVVPFIGKLVVLADGTGVASGVAVDTAGDYGSVLVVDDGGASIRVYPESDDVDAGLIQGYSISPNEQYVAVQVARDLANDVSDNEVEPPSTSVLTIVIDIHTGQRVAALSGLGLLW